MITPAYAPTATERVLPRLALDFTTGVLDPRVTVTRALNTATRINSSGIIEIVNANLPRFDYNPSTLAPLGLLIEETRANRTLQTNDFTVAPWAATVTGTSTRVNDNSTLGFMRGLITATSANGGIRQQHTGLTNGQVYAVSFYVQSTTPSVNVVFENGIANFGSSHFVLINPSNGTAGSPTGFTSVTATPFASGYVYTLITGPAGGNLIANLEFRIVNSGDSMLFGRLQFEAGAFATSFIPTTTAIVTRNADVVQMTGTNFSSWYNASEGAFLAKFSFPAIPASQFRYVLSANDGTATNFIAVAGNTTSNVPAGRVITSSVTQASMGGSAISNNQQIAGVLAYKLNDFAYSQGGATTGTDGSGTVPTVNRLEIGALVGSYANCHMQRISYWPQRIINSETLAFSK